MELIRKKISYIKIYVKTDKEIEGYDYEIKNGYYEIRVPINKINDILKDIIEKYRILDIFIERLTLEDAIKYLYNGRSI